MNLQYISDNMGHTTAVQLQIPIEEWEFMKTKYKEFEDQEHNDSFTIPDWQIERGRKERELIAQGKAGLMSWEEAKKKIRL